MAQIQFNAQAVQPMMPIEPVPEAWYPVVIKSSEGKAVTNKPNSGLCALELEVIDGPYRGRKLFNNLNLWNENPQACEIAGKELSAICHVTSKYVINATEELHNIPFQVKVTVEGNQNRIKGYKDMQGNDPGKHGAPAASAAPAGYAAPPAAAAPAAAAWGAPPAAAPAAAAPAAAWGGGQQAAPAPAAWGGQQQAAPAAAAAPAPAAWAPAGGGAPAGAAPAWARTA